MKKKNLLVVLGLIFGSSVQGAVPVPVINSLDDHLYRTSEVAIAIQDLNKRLNELFDGYPAKDRSFNKGVIDVVRNALDEIDVSLQKVGVHELLSDHDFSKKLKTFEECMEAVAATLAEERPNPSLMIKRSQENKKKVVRELEGLQSAKVDLVAYVKSVGGESSDQVRMATLMREKAKREVLKRFQEFEEEMLRKGQGEATMSLDQLYGKGLLVWSQLHRFNPLTRERYLSPKELVILIDHLKQLGEEREQVMQEKREQDEITRKEKLLSAPHEDERRFVLPHQSQQTTVVKVGGFDGLR